MKQRALTWRIVGTVLLAELLCALALSVASVIFERHERMHTVDVTTRGRADSVMGALQDEDDPGDNLILTPSDLSVPPEDAFTVFAANGTPLGNSSNWSAAFPVPSSPGFSDARVNGQSYRMLRLEGVRVIDPLEHGGVKRPVVVIYAASLRHFWHAVFEAVQFYVGASLIALALTAVVLVWFVRRELAPLSMLADDAARVSTNTWAFRPSEQILRTRELAPLAMSIRTLLANLEEEFAVRRRFVSDAAHELKTALAVTKSSLQLLPLKQRNGEDISAAIERPLGDTQRMEILVGRMLTLGRVDEQPSSKDRHVDLCMAVSASALALAPLAEVRGVQIDARCSGEVRVRLSADDAEILCTNLLANAIEHSASGSAVRIDAAREDATAVLTVADNGEGISAEALPHVFERFFRADKSRSRQTGGSGLGLAICHSIVTKSGGGIEIESAPGKGTTVVVRLTASES